MTWLLEVGTIDAGKTYTLLVLNQRLARWPYGSRIIYGSGCTEAIKSIRWRG